MDLTEIRKLVRLMLRAELSELEIDDTKNGLRVHLKRGASGSGESGMAPIVQMMPPMAAAAPMAMGAPGAAAPAPAAADPLGPDESELPPGTEVFPSPMVGTFYRSASPDADPFVSAGTKVSEDSVLCIVEAMKVMNEIKAEMRCEIVEVLVENGEPVEFGQPLFLIKKG